MNIGKITHPIVMSWSTDNYALVFEDSSGVTHYFTEDGEYDGYSHECHIDGENGQCLN